ncbi:MAG: SMC-Scp complex subunit ScpB [Firmicutes bacterium HGW-Firmicutes-13]|nr:MAG: SMC-Scp complex subunit ScpB [Firmicutes bacterium HGW-Firmicutes-13]
MVNQKALLEAVLFAAGEPVTLKKLQEITGLQLNVIKGAYRELNSDYLKNGGGLELREVAGGYFMTTRPVYAPYVKKLIEGKTRQSLSHAAIETLAIIAYKQPITRLEIEAIRGVKIDKILEKLKLNNLIKEVDRKETIGRPILYGTTREFLRHFGLQSLSDLPPLKENIEKKE